MKFTKKFIDELKTTGKDYFLWDSEVPGFGLKISAAGRKTFVLQYRDSNKNTKRLSLGVYPALHPQLAREKALTTWSDIHKGIDPSRKSPAGVLLFKEVWEDYKTYLLKKQSSPKTLEAIISSEKNYMQELLRLDTSTITRGKILDALKNSPPTMKNRTLSYIKACYNFAILSEKLTVNPCVNIKIPAAKKIVRWLSEEETLRLMRTLEAHPHKNIANLFLFLYHTGARIGEARTLLWEHLDLKNKTWIKPAHLTKQNKDSYIPLTDKAVEILLNQPRINEYVFQKIDHVHAIWSRILKKAGIQNFRIHDLRHNFASMLVSRGVSLEVIGKLLGHSSYQTTQRYAHLSHTALKEALDKLK